MANQKQKKEYHFSPFGEFRFPHLHQPDTKFAGEGSAGVYKVDLGVSGIEGEALRDVVRAAAAAAFDDHFTNGKGAELKQGDRKKWSVYEPFEEEEDDEGNKTGRVWFKPRQNAEIKIKDKPPVKVEIAVWDATGKARVTKPVYSGSIGRVLFTLRPIVMQSTRHVGVRMDFAAVQIKELVSAGSRGGSPFDAVEGYTEDEQGGLPTADAAPAQDSDY